MDVLLLLQPRLHQDEEAGEDHHVARCPLWAGGVEDIEDIILAGEVDIVDIIVVDETAFTTAEDIRTRETRLPRQQDHSTLLHGCKTRGKSCFLDLGKEILGFL